MRNKNRDLNNEWVKKWLVYYISGNENMKSIHDAICHTCIHKNNLFPCRNIHLHHNGLNSHILYVQMFIKKKKILLTLIRKLEWNWFLIIPIIYFPARKCELLINDQNCVVLHTDDNKGVRGWMELEMPWNVPHLLVSLFIGS